MAKYLGVDYANGSLYEYSKTQKEGFQKHESQTGKVTYRRYELRGVTGSLQSVEIRDSKIGEQINISLKVEDEFVVIKLPLYDQSGNVQKDYAEPFIRVVGNMQKGVTYKIQPYLFTGDAQKELDQKDGKDIKEKYYDRTGVSVKLEDGTKVDATLFYGGDNPDTAIPMVVWKDHPTKPGKRKPSAASLEEKAEFLIAKLKQAIDSGLASESNSSNSSPTPPKAYNNPPEPEEQEMLAEEEYDDLPF